MELGNIFILIFVFILIIIVVYFIFSWGAVIRRKPTVIGSTTYMKPGLNMRCSFTNSNTISFLPEDYVPGTCDTDLKCVQYNPDLSEGICKRTLDAPCETVWDCEPGVLYCTGFCSMTPGGGKNQKCLPNDECLEGFTCKSNICKVNSGGNCNENSDCYSNICLSGICLEGKTIGQKCSVENPCASGLYCSLGFCQEIGSPATGELGSVCYVPPNASALDYPKCKAGVCSRNYGVDQLPDDYGHCLNENTKWISTCESTACLPTYICQNSTCVAPLDDANNCGSGSSYSCIDGYVCAEGSSMARCRPTIGNLCKISYGCLTGTCSSTSMALFTWINQDPTAIGYWKPILLDLPITNYYPFERYPPTSFDYRTSSLTSATIQIDSTETGVGVFDIIAYWSYGDSKIYLTTRNLSTDELLHAEYILDDIKNSTAVIQMIKLTPSGRLCLLAKNNSSGSGWRLYDFNIDTFTGTKHISISGRPTTPYISVPPNGSNDITIDIINNFDIDDISSTTGMKVFLAASSADLKSSAIFYTYQSTINFDSLSQFAANPDSLEGNIHQYRYLQAFTDPTNSSSGYQKDYFGIDYTPNWNETKVSLWKDSSVEMVIDPGKNNEYISFASTMNINTPISRGHYLYVGVDRAEPSKNYIKWATPTGIYELPGNVDYNSLVTLTYNGHGYDRLYLIANYCQ